MCGKCSCAERDEGLLSGPVELGFTVMKAPLKWTRVGAKCLIEHSLLQLRVDKLSWGGLAVDPRAHSSRAPSNSII